MSDVLKELYQELIMDHSRNPRLFGKPEIYTHSKASYNPLCGDKITLYGEYDPQGILQVHFEGSGCAMCLASTSLLLDSVQNKSMHEMTIFLQKLFTLLHTSELSDSDQEALGKCIVLKTVKQYPSRIKCVTLSWHALKDLIALVPQGGSHTCI